MSDKTKENKDVLKKAISDLELIKEEAEKIAREKLSKDIPEMLEDIGKKKIQETQKKEDAKSKVNESTKGEKVEKKKEADKAKGKKVNEDVQITIKTDAGEDVEVDDDAVDSDGEEVVAGIDTDLDADAEVESDDELDDIIGSEVGEESEEEEEIGEAEEPYDEELNWADIEKELSEMEAAEVDDLDISDINLDDLDDDVDEMKKVGGLSGPDQNAGNPDSSGGPTSGKIEEEEDELDERHGIGHYPSREQSATTAPSPEYAKYRKNQLRSGVREMQEGFKKKYNQLLESHKNLNKKVSKLIGENKELAKVNNDMVDALKKYKAHLQEMVILNANSTNINKIFVSESTTIDEKKDIIKRFKSVKSVDESNALYESVKKELDSKKTLNENIEEDNKLKNSASSSTTTKLVESTAYSKKNEQLDKMKGIIKRLENR